MIDFDNPNTFPKELRNWGTEFEKMILRRVVKPKAKLPLHAGKMLRI